jgi:hypothetical protein
VVLSTCVTVSSEPPLTGGFQNGRIGLGLTHRAGMVGTRAGRPGTRVEIESGPAWMCRERYAHKFISTSHRVLGQHLNPLVGFHVRALQEDTAVTGSDQRLMGEVKNRMVG